MKKIWLAMLSLAFIGAACNADKSLGSAAWDFDMERQVWTPDDDPPECPPLELASPVDVNQATSILYPGQYRGLDGNYRAHGGFRFDKQSSTEVEVRAPFDAYVFRGSRYLVGGQIQYVFDFVHPCGVTYRLGHLYKLAPSLQKLADKFPEPKEMDSRDYRTARILFKKEELLATDVGVPGNVFLDWGVYDLRSENPQSQNAAYRETHQWMAQHAFYAICWLDFLPENEKQIVYGLPGGDGRVGKTSDYCK